jgi:diguanylate cyclase (GGDEF)-like protein
MEEAAPLWGIISNPYALSLVIGANSLAIALSVLFSAGSYPQPISRSLHVFGVTKALIAAGFALIALRSELSPLWSVVAGNTLAMGGFAGNLAALWILQRKPVRYWFPVSVVLATLIGSWWFSFVTPDLRGLRICTSLVTLFVIATTADELLRRYKGGGRAHVLGGLLAATTVFLMLLRIYSALTAEFQPGHHLASDWMERMFFCAAYIIATMSALNFTLISNDVFNAELRQAAASDPLTGLPNRRRLMERGAEEAKRALRYRRPLTVLVLDLDHFKLINDEYGHAVGDDALKATAQCCRDALRDVDMFARLGGEEFVAVLTETGLEDAAAAAERLRVAVSELRLPQVPSLRLTVSIGVAALRDSDLFEAAVAHADAAMYQAKKAGRNQVRISE